MNTSAVNGPFMLDTRRLGRRPGSEFRVHREAPAPAGLGTEVLGVPERAPVRLDLRLEGVVEGVLVSGTVRTHVEGECVRCLEPLERAVEVELQELYVHPASEVGDDEARRLDGDLADLEPAVRDAVVLALPFQPVCRADCPGLCPRCGVRLADEPDHAHDDPIDPRWAALRGLGSQPGRRDRPDE